MLCTTAAAAGAAAAAAAAASAVAASAASAVAASAVVDMAMMIICVLLNRRAGGQFTEALVHGTTHWLPDRPRRSILYKFSPGEQLDSETRDRDAETLDLPCCCLTVPPPPPPRRAAAPTFRFIARLPPPSFGSGWWPLYLS